VLARRTRDGDRLLFVEDINDSGKTIGEIRAALGAEGAIASRIRFAVLLDNVRSSQRVDYRAPDRSTRSDKDWFVFPWEAMAPRDTLPRKRWKFRSASRNWRTSFSHGQSRICHDSPPRTGHPCRRVRSRRQCPRP
jgi:hypoxanthine phosphoribosyltransferase